MLIKAIQDLVKTEVGKVEQLLNDLHTKIDALATKEAPAVQQAVTLAEGEAEKIAEAVDQKLAGDSSEASSTDSSATKIPVTDGDAPSTDQAQTS